MREAKVERVRDVITGPLEEGLLDRLARILDGANESGEEPLPELVDLTRVAPGAPAEIAAFYRNPDRYEVCARAVAGPWGRCALLVFAAGFRQCCVPVGSAGGRTYQVCQRLYLDKRQRRHWDRYVRVDGVVRRLFVARVEASEQQVDETFVLWGVPARLAFDVCVEDSAVVLTLNRAKSSTLAWPLRVQYRTVVGQGGVLHTEGDFRVPMAGVQARTQFTITPVYGGSG
jgi:hypothetical protein